MNPVTNLHQYQNKVIVSTSNVPGMDENAAITLEADNDIKVVTVSNAGSIKQVDNIRSD